MKEDLIPKIIFENSDILVLNKPAGLVVHSDGKTEESTLCDWVIKNYPEMAGVGEPLIISGKTIDRPGIVHRLDRETSGVILLAKNQESFLYLKEQFQNREIEKHYRTYVWGWFPEKEGIVDKPIGRSPSDFRRWLSGNGARGELREAVTKYKVLKEFADKKGDRFSYLDVSPKTGRTHQIRVHMKYLQRPLICDKLYAPKNPPALGFERTALHAYSITLNLPKTGERATFEAPLPDDFLNAETKFDI